MLSIANKNNRGFTLVELLVVIAIIALLLSILMPALNRARGHGKEIVCKSYMHNILIANVAYASDNADTIHTTYYVHEEYMTNPNADPNLLGWMWILKPYLPTKEKNWKCPDDQSRYVKSYMANNSVNRTNKISGPPELKWIWGRGPTGQKQSQVVQPSQTIMYTDSAIKGLAVPPDHDAFDGWNCYMDDMGDYIIYPPFTRYSPGNQDWLDRPHTTDDEARVLGLLDTSVVKLQYPFAGKAKWAWDIGYDKLAPLKRK